MGLIPFIRFKNHPLRREVDSIANDEIFIENVNLENVGDTIHVDNSRENENEYYNRSSCMLFTPTLEDLKNFLYIALNPYFEEFEIAVVSCPCLTRAPYNLAAAGLSGNTSILELGDFDYFCPRPRTNFAFNIQDMLSRYNYDVFVIGSGFAAQPFMSYNGHLTMNAVVSANSTNVINNSCIAYENASTGQRRLEIINSHNQIKCCLSGQFFFSEGKRGMVIKMRAKGRRSRSNIIALIQTALTNRCRDQPLISLGIVLVLNGGQTEQHLLPDNFVNNNYNKIQDYYNQLSQYPLNCINLIALGTLTSDPLMIFKDYDESVNSYSMFNTLSNDESFGNFFNDITPEETEYIAYINIAQERYSVM
ncbi:hypothetical protein ACFW04_005109 [Cataglyphis niger]